MFIIAREELESLAREHDGLARAGVDTVFSPMKPGEGVESFRDNEFDIADSTPEEVISRIEAAVEATKEWYGPDSPDQWIRQEWKEGDAQMPKIICFIEFEDGEVITEEA